MLIVLVPFFKSRTDNMGLQRELRRSTLSLGRSLALPGDKPHRRTRRRFCDRLCIRHIVLLALYERLHVGGWYQPHLVAETADRPAPVVLTGTGFHRCHAKRLRSRELQQLRARQLAAEDHRSVRCGTMRLKHVLGQIKADDANFAHGRSPL